MSDENQQTIAAYQAHMEEYITRSPGQVAGYLQAWIDGVLARVPKGGKVLELGSGSGRDAAYIEQAGFAVWRTDATPGFVDRLRRNGHDTQLLNAITDDLGGPYDLVFANAVLLHFTVEEFTLVIQKVYAGLSRGGTFAFSVQQGTGSEWRSNKLGASRFFQYWSPAALSSALAAVGYTHVSVSENDSGKWLHVIAEKH